MSEQKPKKDLRARLGRTIAPNTPGAPAIAPPGGITPPAVTPPAAAPPAATPAAAAPTASTSASTSASEATPAVTPPAAVAPPVIAPPVVAPAKLPFGNDIAPPPFAKPAEPAKPEKKRPDPFAEPAKPQEVRIAIDDKPVDDADVGRRQTGRIFLVAAATLFLGTALGWGVGTMNGRRVLYNTTVRDGHAIYEAVHHASTGVLEAQQHVEALATSAGGGPTGHPTVNYDELTALTAMPDPLPASAFSDKNYNAFQPGTVDDLFTYYSNIHELWRQFRQLSTIANGPAEPPSIDQFAAAAVCPIALHHDQAATRARIQAAADATASAASAQYVAALSTGSDGTVRGALRFAEPELDASGQPTGHILMHAAPGETGTQVELWAAGTAITATPDHAIIVDGASSAGVLGERLGSFRDYVQQLSATRTLMTNTIEIQGRLTTSLGEIAAIEEVAAF
ncbi:MAG: hypothetical protein U0234_18815 [Sandaracinus sp.]